MVIFLRLLYHFNGIWFNARKKDIFLLSIHVNLNRWYKYNTLYIYIQKHMLTSELWLDVCPDMCIFVCYSTFYNRNSTTWLFIHSYERKNTKKKKFASEIECAIECLIYERLALNYKTTMIIISWWIIISIERIWPRFIASIYVYGSSIYHWLSPTDGLEISNNLLSRKKRISIIIVGFNCWA